MCVCRHLYICSIHESLRNINPIFQHISAVVTSAESGKSHVPDHSCMAFLPTIVYFFKGSIRVNSQSSRPHGLSVGDLVTAGSGPASADRSTAGGSTGLPVHHLRCPVLRVEGMTGDDTTHTEGGHRRCLRIKLDTTISARF